MNIQGCILSSNIAPQGCILGSTNDVHFYVVFVYICNMRKSVWTKELVIMYETRGMKTLDWWSKEIHSNRDSTRPSNAMYASYLGTEASRHAQMS